MSESRESTEVQLELFDLATPSPVQHDMVEQLTPLANTGFSESALVFARKAQVGELLHSQCIHGLEPVASMLDDALAHLNELGSRGQIFAEFVRERFNLSR